MPEINQLTKNQPKSFAEKNSELFYSGAQFKFKGGAEIYRYVGSKATGHIVVNNQHIVCDAAAFDSVHFKVTHPFFPIGIIAFHTLDFKP